MRLRSFLLACGLEPGPGSGKGSILCRVSRWMGPRRSRHSEPGMHANGPLSCGMCGIKTARVLAFVSWLGLAAIVHAQQLDSDRPARPDDASGAASIKGAADQQPGAVAICQMAAAAAAANELPFEFFARVIWQESRFRSDVVGPVTRTGQRAQGIAQFMPMTAAERLLSNPFDPAEALPKSAKFLRELQEQFGNLGLAAAAYNAGPTRVRDWLAGRRTLPSETQAYVRIVTGRHAEEWRPQVTLSNLNLTVPRTCRARRSPLGFQSRTRNRRASPLPLGACSSPAISPRSRRSPLTAHCRRSTRQFLAATSRWLSAPHQDKRRPELDAHSYRCRKPPNCGDALL